MEEVNLRITVSLLNITEEKTCTPKYSPVFTAICCPRLCDEERATYCWFGAEFTPLSSRISPWIIHCSYNNLLKVWRKLK